MRSVNVIQYGVGSIGSKIVKLLLKKKGIKIVGAIDTAEDKVGKDLGEVIGLGKKLGVTISNDPEKVFSENYADIVTHSVSPDLMETYRHIEKPIREGINIISTSEGLGNAYAVNPELAAKIDLLARKHEVAVLGTGITPGVFEPLLLILTGLCSKIKRIKYVRVTSAAAYAPNSVVRKNFGVDVKSVDEFEKAVKNGIITGHIGFEWSIPMIADKLGWRIDEIKCELKPFIVNGKVIGSKKICRGIVDGKELIYMELDAHANPEVETYDEFVVEGEPPINLKCKPFIEGSASTASVIVHMIPIVINAEPGLYTPADLPLPVYYEDVRLLIKKQ